MSTLQATRLCDGAILITVEQPGWFRLTAEQWAGLAEADWDMRYIERVEEKRKE